MLQKFRSPDMASWLPHHPLKGKLVEQKIKRLSVFQIGEDSKGSAKSSPAWRELHKGPSRVKKLSMLFEEHSKGNGALSSWWLEDQTLESPPTSSSQRKTSLGRLGSRSSNSPAKFTSKIDGIVNELLQKELTYIDALDRGIQVYTKFIKEGSEEVPAVLRHQTFRLFGNIEEIFKLHVDSVYPRLLLCNGNARQLAETITSFILSDSLYCYINYAINFKSAEQLIAQHQKFFENLRNEAGDLLGINSFVIQPIQKLPRYKMLMDEMIKELEKDIHEPWKKAATAACCVAEKNVQRLLRRLNDALTITDIVETRQFGVSFRTSTLTTMQRSFGMDINEPMMMVVPKTSSNFPFRSPVSLTPGASSMNFVTSSKSS